MKAEVHVREIESDLQPLGTHERAVGSKAYLKSDLGFLGVTQPDLRRYAKSWLRTHSDMTAPELLAVVETLWNTRLHELKAFAIELPMLRPECLSKHEIELLERMLRTSGTWAYVDAIAVQLVGPLVERHPALTKRLDAWAADDDFWIRRSALLALLIPLRRGEGDWDRFVRYADSMLAEKEFFIRKAIGWILRETSKKQPQRVIDYLAARPGRLSGVTLREAVKYIPPASGV